MDAPRLLKKRAGGLPVRWPVVLVGSMAAASPAVAQYPPPGSVAPPLSITISRDVPQRPAFDPGQPGTVQTVNVAPVDVIFGATNKTVSILTDDQTAAISAGIDSQRGGLGVAMAGADAALNPQLANGPGQVSQGSFAGGVGGTITNVIGTATGAIGRALSPLSGKGD